MQAPRKNGDFLFGWSHGQCEELMVFGIREYNTFYVPASTFSWCFIRIQHVTTRDIGVWSCDQTQWIPHGNSDRNFQAAPPKPWERNGRPRVCRYQLNIPGINWWNLMKSDEVFRDLINELAYLILSTVTVCYSIFFLIVQWREALIIFPVAQEN